MKVELEVIDSDPIRLKILLDENKKGVLAVLSAVFFMHDLSVISARQVSGEEGNLMDEFVLQSAEPFSQKYRKKILEDIQSILNKEKNAWEYLQEDPAKFEIVSTGRKRLRSDSFRLRMEKGGAVLDVEVEDRPGLLFEISYTLFLLYIDIKDFSARTEHGVAYDRFLLQREDGSELPPDMMERVAQTLPKIL